MAKRHARFKKGSPEAKRYMARIRPKHRILSRIKKKVIRHVRKVQRVHRHTRQGHHAVRGHHRKSHSHITRHVIHPGDLGKYAAGAVLGGMLIGMIAGGSPAAPPPPPPPPPAADVVGVSLSTPSANNLVVTLNGSITTSIGADSITSVVVNWGDSTLPITGALPQSHTYAFSGTYLIQVFATDNTGVTGGSTTSVDVTSPPPASDVVTVILDTPSVSSNAYFNNAVITINGTASVSIGADNIISIEANWGDGTNILGTQFPLGHTYEQTGTFTLTVTATDNTGKTGTATTIFIVTAVTTDTMVISASAVVSGAKVTLSGSASSSVGNSISLYEINWGDGTGIHNYGTLNGTSYTYTASGTYTITILALDSAGTDKGTSVTATVTVPTSGTLPALPGEPFVAVFTAATPSYSTLASYTRVVVYNGKAYTMGTSSDTWAQTNNIPLYAYNTTQANFTSEYGLTLVSGGDQAAAAISAGTIPS